MVRGMHTKYLDPKYLAAKDLTDTELLMGAVILLAGQAHEPFPLTDDQHSKIEILFPNLDVEHGDRVTEFVNAVKARHGTLLDEILNQPIQ